MLIKHSCMILFFFFAADSSLQAATTDIAGKWKVGEPFTDMAPEPVGLTSVQLRKLIGHLITIDKTSITACHRHIPIKSRKKEQYSAESFLQKYGISPSQIGLETTVTEISFSFAPPRMICGNAEGFVILTDGRSAVLEDGNAYFALSKK